jgi:mannose-6-phosphate isomerase
MRDYIDWIVDKALPLWATRGFDQRNGRFHERLDLTGKPLAVPHRAMVQARQIYVFAHAASLGWFPAGGELAAQAMNTLRREFCAHDAEVSSFAFAVDPASGSVIGADRDAYTHAFILFAIAQLYRLDRDSTLLDLADRTIAFIERDLHDPVHGGLRESFPATSSHKRQNPQMHLLEAYIALHAAAPDRGYLRRAQALVSLFTDRLFSSRYGVLIEHFNEEWSDHVDPAKAGLFEPGHHYEWVWLLNEHEKITGEDLQDWRHRLTSPAEQHGHAASGLIYDELDTNMRVVRSSHRLWPHTEAIKAATVRHASGDLEALPAARKMASLLSEHFLDRAFEGGWIDHIDQDLRPMVGYVPASSLYHLFLAAAEADAAFHRADPAAGSRLTGVDV